MSKTDCECILLVEALLGGFLAFLAFADALIVLHMLVGYCRFAKQILSFHVVICHLCGKVFRGYSQSGQEIGKRATVFYAKALFMSSVVCPPKRTASPAVQNGTALLLVSLQADSTTAPQQI